MKRRFFLPGVVVVLAAVWLLPASLRAENFVFTNNDLYGANSVTTFSVDPSTFALTNLGTTLTGGTNCGGDLYLRSILASPEGNYLYVANGGSADISTFRINPATGGLTAVGTPVATGNYAGCAGGGASAGLAMTQQGNILYAANRGADTLSIYSVARDGKLTMVGSPLPMPGTPFSVQVRAPGEFLAVGLLVAPDDNSAVAMFRIGPRGELTAVPGSPFAVAGEDLQWDFDCGCHLLFSTQLDIFGGGTTVDVLEVGRDGALSPVHGSPFYFDQATNTSAGVLWNPIAPMLFVSSGGSNSIEDFIVGPRGKLKSGANQPVNLGSPAAPIGMAVNQIRTRTDMIKTLLYAADFSSSSVHVLTVDDDGTLTPVPGSPFPTGQGEYSGLGQLAVVPGGECSGAENRWWW